MSIELKKLLNSGFLKPSESPWALYLFLLKKDGVHQILWIIAGTILLLRSVATHSLRSIVPYECWVS